MIPRYKLNFIVLSFHYEHNKKRLLLFGSRAFPLFVFFTKHKKRLDTEVPSQWGELLASSFEFVDIRRKAGLRLLLDAGSLCSRIPCFRELRLENFLKVLANR